MRRAGAVLIGGEGGASARADAGLLVLRVFVGLGLALGHGMGKMPPSERFIGGVAGMGFPAPALFGWAAGLAEFAGGLLLALGLLTRPSAFFILPTMLVAAFLREGPSFGDKEKALLYAAAAVLFVLAGAGRYSLDALIRRRSGPPA